MVKITTKMLEKGRSQTTQKRFNQITDEVQFDKVSKKKIYEIGDSIILKKNRLIYSDGTKIDFNRSENETYQQRHERYEELITFKVHSIRVNKANKQKLTLIDSEGVLYHLLY